MSQPEMNVRLRRTQKLLREALVDLIDERGFDAITVGALTERALVSRAAFYRNYQDKYDLVEQIFAEAMRTLLAAVGDLGREHPTEIGWRSSSISPYTNGSITRCLASRAAPGLCGRCVRRLLT